MGAAVVIAIDSFEMPVARLFISLRLFG